MSEYQEQALDFLHRSGTTMKIVRLTAVEEFPFSNDKMMHYKYSVRLYRNGKRYCTIFHDNFINFRNNIRPTEYDVLSGITSYPVNDNMWDFAKEFGYTINNEKTYNQVKNIHKACVKEYKALENLFDGWDEENNKTWLEELQEIY